VNRWKALAPAQRGWRIENAVGGGEAELYIYDFIDSWGGEWGVSATEVVNALATVRAPLLHVHLNSPGGDYFEGVAIRTALQNHAAAVTIHVDGLAASAASVIATAGERCVIARGAQIMIHEARSVALGTADDMRASAELLDKIGDDIAAMYAARAGQGDTASWRALMQAETWFTADEAVAAGLADEVADGSTTSEAAAATASAAAARWIATWQRPDREAPPGSQIPAAAAEAAVPPAPPIAATAASDTSKFDPEHLRSAIRKAKNL
jgi:ATP-dependent protease ClpP protease subunit